MIAEVVISLLLVIAGVFGLIGSLGLLKLRLPMQRLFRVGEEATEAAALRASARLR